MARSPVELLRYAEYKWIGDVKKLERLLARETKAHNRFVEEVGRRIQELRHLCHHEWDNPGNEIYSCIKCGYVDGTI